MAKARLSTPTLREVENIIGASPGPTPWWVLNYYSQQQCFHCEVWRKRSRLWRPLCVRKSWENSVFRSNERNEDKWTEDPLGEDAGLFNIVYDTVDAIKCRLN